MEGRLDERVDGRLVVWMEEGRMSCYSLGVVVVVISVVVLHKLNANLK